MSLLVKFAGKQPVAAPAEKLEVLRKKYLPVETIYLLLDCSGSMAEGRKLEQAKAGVREFMKKADNKKVNFIAFSCRAKVVSLGNLNEIVAGGSTNMTEAIRLTTEGMPKSGRRAIVIATDGIPDNPQTALEAANAAKAKGVKIICIGTDDADEEFLKKLSSQRNLGRKVEQRNFGKAIANTTRLLLN